MVLNLIISFFAFVLFLIPVELYKIHQQNLNLPIYAQIIILVLGGALAFILLVSWFTAFISAPSDDVSGIGFIVLWYEKLLETLAS